MGLRKLRRLRIHAEPLGRAWREDDLCAEHAHELSALDRETLGHGDDQRIPLGGTDHGEADAGIAARRLDNGLAGSQGTAPFRLLDDADCQPVLDRCGGVEEFGLHIDLDIFRSDIVDADTGCVADRIDHAVKQPALPICRTDSVWIRHCLAPMAAHALH